MIRGMTGQQPGDPGSSADPYRYSRPVGVGVFLASATAPAIPAVLKKTAGSRTRFFCVTGKAGWNGLFSLSLSYWNKDRSMYI